MSGISIDAVKKFWEESPLFVGESIFKSGSREFFEDHSLITIEDCFAGQIDRRIFPTSSRGTNLKILDAGCGIGFWLEQFGGIGYKRVIGIDISTFALSLARTRMKIFNQHFGLIEGNIERMPFEDKFFDHVNCQGVIHHTPNPEAAIAEIARVLKPDGTALISVYYENILLRNFTILKPLMRLFARLGFALKGRGRESIFYASSSNELVRQFDGAENPLGISYSKGEFRALLTPVFHINEMFIHYFPRRVFPKVPSYLHRFLDKYCGFMIFASVSKQSI